MIYKTVKSVVDTITWAASSDLQLDLPTDGRLTRLQINANFTVTGCLAAATNTQLCQYKPFQNIKIEGGGGRTYFGMSGEQMGRMLHILNRLDFPGIAPHAAMATNTIYSSLILHFGSFPRLYGQDNPFDETAFIPAKDETNLKLTITTAAAVDIADTAIDISAGTIKATAYQVLGKPMAGGMMPVSSSYSHPTLGSAVSDLGQEFDIPTRAFVRRIVLLTQDHTAVTSGGPLLADDIFSKAGILLPMETRRLVEIDDEALASMCGVLADGYDVGAAADANKVEGYQFPGFYVIDLRNLAHPTYGLDLRAYEKGAAKLAFTIPSGSSGDDILIWYDQVQPYAGK